MGTKEYTCAVCGKVFIGTTSRECKYCSPPCRYRAKYLRSKEYYYTHKEMAGTKMDIGQSESLKKLIEYKKRLEHQKDTSVWTRDYAEKQKAKTLAMLGDIKDEL